MKERNELEKKIMSIPKGKVFSYRDLGIAMSDASLRQGLKRLVDKGFIRRTQRGYFERPLFSKFLQENLETDMVKMAQAIARNNKWTIAPSGNTALNMLGVSTQVPSQWTFVSDGPYKSFFIDEKKIEFRHRANRSITGLSQKSLLVIHALKSLSQDETTPEVIATIKTKLTPSEKRKLLKDAKFVPRRIAGAISKICEDLCTK